MSRWHVVPQVAGAFLLFLLLTGLGRSVLLISGILGALLLAPYLNLRSPKMFFKALDGPFLPFAVTAMLVAPFQEKGTDSLWLLSISLCYVVARLLRQAVSLYVLIMAAVGVALALGLVFSLGSFSLGEQLPVFEDLSGYLHKNVFGWNIGIGLASLPFFIALHRRAQSTGFWLSAAAFFLIGGFLAATSSMASFVAASLAFGVATVLILFKGKPGGGGAGHFGPLVYPFFALLALFFFALVNAIRPQEGPLASLVRDWGLTGRTKLWTCYLDFVGDGGGETLDSVMSCAGHAHANLHNNFLEAYYIGGPLLLTSLVLCFALAGLGSLKALLGASSGLERREAILGIGIFLFAFLLSFAESFLFSRHMYISLIIFLASNQAKIGPVLAAVSSRMKHLGFPGRRKPGSWNR